MTTPDKTIEELLALAEKADRERVMTWPADPEWWHESFSMDDAAFLAACSPDRIVSLCRRLQAAEKVVEAARAVAGFTGTHNLRLAGGEIIGVTDVSNTWLARLRAALSEGSEKK
ncbi:MAG: hypothetical protein HY323_08190 [Betaproteobacteria bacterium]|nr:hypothetical protein [Betaproteobacteria bacterium]